MFLITWIFNLQVGSHLHSLIFGCSVCCAVPVMPSLWFQRSQELPILRVAKWTSVNTVCSCVRSCRACSKTAQAVYTLLHLAIYCTGLSRESVPGTLDQQLSAMQVTELFSFSSLCLVHFSIVLQWACLFPCVHWWSCVSLQTWFFPPSGPPGFTLRLTLLE